MKGRIQPGPATLLLIPTLWSVDAVWAQNDTISNPNYDAELAKEVGGDDYGMKSYFLVILKTGANTTADKEQINASFRCHLENINKLVEQEKLVVVGPLGPNEHQYRVIFILNNITTTEEAQELLDTDPAIDNGFWLMTSILGMVQLLYRSICPSRTKSGSYSLRWRLLSSARA